MYHFIIFYHWHYFKLTKLRIINCFISFFMDSYVFLNVLHCANTLFLHVIIQQDICITKYVRAFGISAIKTFLPILIFCFIPYRKSDNFTLGKNILDWRQSIRMFTYSYRRLTYKRVTKHHMCIQNKLQDGTMIHSGYNRWLKSYE